VKTVENLQFLLLTFRELTYRIVKIARMSTSHCSQLS